VEEVAIDSGYYGAKTDKTWWEPYRILGGNLKGGLNLWDVNLVPKIGTLYLTEISFKVCLEYTLSSVLCSSRAPLIYITSQISEAQDLRFFLSSYYQHWVSSWKISPYELWKFTKWTMEVEEYFQLYIRNGWWHLWRSSKSHQH
jgi:hypothetical protein